MHTLQLARVGIRGIQVLFTLLALILIASGFHSQTSDYATSNNLTWKSQSHSMMLGSSSSIFAILMTYTGLLYSLWYCLAVELTSFARPFLPLYEKVIDGVLVVMLLIAGIAFAASDYVSDCNSYGIWLKCGALTAGVVFTFLAMVTFIGSLGGSFMFPRDRDSSAVPQGYHVEATPTGSLSPIGIQAPATRDSQPSKF